MKKLAADDPRAAQKASDVRIGSDELREFVAGKHQWILATTRSDGRPQMSPVTGAMTPDGRLLVSSYPERAKSRNARRRPWASVLVMGERFSDPWVQIDGVVDVLESHAAGDGLVEYYRSISGEHPDWEEYRQAMLDQGKCLISIEPTRWGPVSKGGFPPSLFEG